MKMDEKILTRLRRTVYALITLFVISFLAGFLQSTKFEFIIYISYFIFLVVGVKLIFLTLKSKVSKLLKGFLLLSGFTSTVYFLFFVFALIGSIISDMGIVEILTSLEGLLYINSALFLIGVIGSLVFIKN